MKGRGRWLLAWWALWRLPFWRPLPDFFDSPEYIWRVRCGFWSGLHDPGGHLPFQGTLYGPAGLLFTLAGGRLSEAACIAIFSTLYGLLAYATLLHLWQRFFDARTALLAGLLYPMLAGPALADVSTYSMSALHFFLFGGTALLDDALARNDRKRVIGAAVLLGLAAYTHLLALLWLSVPAVVVVARLAKTRREEWPRVIMLGVALPAVAIVLALGISGWEIAHVGRADSTWGGVKALLLRDSGYDTHWRFKIRDLMLVTGGLGIAYAIAGLICWVWRERVWGAIATAMICVSFVACGFQYHWGFIGRLYLPALVWVVPAMVGVFSSRSTVANALVAILFVQSAITTIFVLGTRRIGPHSNAEELKITADIASHGDSYVSAEMNRTYNEDRKVVVWKGHADAAAIRELPGRVFVSSQAVHAPTQIRDGHLVATHIGAPARELTGFEKFAQENYALVLDWPTGRGEYVAELLPHDRAPSIEERLTAAQRFLFADSGLIVVAMPHGQPAWVRTSSPGWRDCKSQESYDAWEITSILSNRAHECDPLQTGATDATGILMRPIVAREVVNVTAYPKSQDDAPLGKVEIRSGEFGSLPLGIAAEILDRAPRSFVALVFGNPDGSVRMAMKKF